MQIDQHLHNTNFNVSFLADLMHTSSASLYRKIKTLCGCTPSTYIRNRRMERAKEMLQSGKYINLNQIATKVGYTQKSSFFHHFQQAYPVYIASIK